MSNAPQAKVERATDPAVRVTIDGRERELRFNMWSVCQLEEVTGQPWHQVIGEIRRDFGRANVRLLWACLQHEKDPPTIRAIAQSLPLDGSQAEVFNAAFRVMLDSLPKPSEGAAGVDPLAERGVEEAA